MIRIGLISDTHGLVRPQALAALHGVDHIIHAGDIVKPEILGELRRIAPLTAVRGNNDRGAWADELDELARVELAGTSLLVIHDVKALREVPSGVRVVVAGHSHRPRAEERAGALYVNPGSAGPRRFKLPVTVGELLLDQGRVAARIVELAV